MKNYCDSDYAANKYANGIVYRFSNQIIEITLVDYLRENPNKTEADFLELKALSDEMYLNQAQSENRQTYKNVPLNDLDETTVCCIPSLEEILIEEPERVGKRGNLRNKAHQSLIALTKIQRRRYIQHHARGLSTWAIAAREGVNQKSVHESLQAAEKKIKKYFEDN